jgi:hypothetical protein
MRHSVDLRSFFVRSCSSHQRPTQSPDSTVQPQTCRRASASPWRMATASYYTVYLQTSANYRKRSRKLRVGIYTMHHRTRLTVAKGTTGSTSGTSHPLLPKQTGLKPKETTAAPYGRSLYVARKSADWQTSASSLSRHGLISRFGLSRILYNARSGA